MKRLPPPRDRYWLLDGAAGWREDAPADASAGILVSRPELELTLPQLPGPATELFENDGERKEFRCASGVAVDACGYLWVADAGAHLIRRVRLADRKVTTVLGGRGTEARRFEAPRGVAALANGDIAVADTGNHRVQIFTPPPYALRKVCGAADAMGRPVAGSGAGEFYQPWGLAAAKDGTLYVADRGNHRVQALEPRMGTFRQLGTGLLHKPARVALNGDGTLAVADELGVLLMTASGTAGERFGPAGARSVAFASNGLLYVGDSSGLVHAFRVEGLQARGEGIGSSQLAGPLPGEQVAIDDLAVEAAVGLIALVSAAARPRLWRMDPKGARAQDGVFTTQALDSGIERCQWHRIELRASVPEHTSIRLETQTAESVGGQPPPVSEHWTECAVVGSDNPECLVQSGPGQFLRVRLTLTASGAAAPSVRSIKTWFPRRSYLEYLPAVYQEDEESRQFLDRWLSIFQTGFDSHDRRIDELWQLFDPRATDDRYLRWLASWIALPVGRDWPASKLREMIRAAHAPGRPAYPIRGTARGLERTVVDYAGVAWAIAVEHYRMRRWALHGCGAQTGTTRLWSRGFNQHLQVDGSLRLGEFRVAGVPEPAAEPFEWGAHRFTLFFPADPYDAEEATRQVDAIVASAKPAHTAHEICPVYPRFRIGVQASVGVDTAVGAVSHLVLGRNATLNYDAVLACSVPERQIRSLRYSKRAVAGVTTRLS